MLVTIRCKIELEECGCICRKVDRIMRPSSVQSLSMQTSVCSLDTCVYVYMCIHVCTSTSHLKQLVEARRIRLVFGRIRVHLCGCRGAFAQTVHTGKIWGASESKSSGSKERLRVTWKMASRYICVCYVHIESYSSKSTHGTYIKSTPKVRPGSKDTLSVQSSTDSPSSIPHVVHETNERDDG